jgi:hypothetical protein
LTICAAGGAFSGHHSFAPAPAVENVALFNPQTPGAQASIVIDHQGNKFISMAPTVEIRKDDFQQDFFSLSERFPSLFSPVEVNSDYCRPRSRGRDGAV